MGKYGNYKLPRFADMVNRQNEEVDEKAEDDNTNPVDHEKSLAQILKMGEAGEDFVKLTIKTEDGEEIELKFDYDGMGMIHSEHNGQKYSIPVEINVEGEEEGEEEIEEPCEDCLKHAEEEEHGGKAAHKAHGAFADFLAETYNGGQHPSANVKAYDLLQKDLEMLVDNGEDPKTILHRVKTILGISSSPRPAGSIGTDGHAAYNYKGDQSILPGLDA